MRGVNKLVVEVRPDDGYFEKAILFLKPEKCSSPQKEISDTAEKLLNGISDKNITESKHKFSTAVLLFAGITAGSALTWLIVLLIGSV